MNDTDITEEFNPYIAAEAEYKLKACETERRNNKFFATAIKLRERLIKSSRKIRQKHATNADFEKHRQLLDSFNKLFEMQSIVAEKNALTYYEELLKLFYDDTITKTETDIQAIRQSRFANTIPPGG